LLTKRMRAVTPAGLGAASPSWIAASSAFGGGGLPLLLEAVATATPPTTTAIVSAAPAMSLRVEVVRRKFTGQLL
jgi:hypothetical protein